jgi:hypothetical protein
MCRLRSRIVSAWTAWIALAVTSLAAEPSAFAQSPPAPTLTTQDAASPRKGAWYGWQILVIDGLALVAGTVALPQTGGDSGVRSAAFAGAALAGYILGGPVVHAVHREFGKGGISLGLRTGGPFSLAALGIFVGAVVGGLKPPALTGSIVGMEIGLGVGAVVASAVDVALFSFEKPRPAETTTPAAPTALQLAPTLGLPRDVNGRTTPTAGLAGTF